MPVHHLLRRCRRLLTGGNPAPGGGRPFLAQARRFTTAQTLVRAFYAVLLYLAVSRLTSVGDLLGRRAYSLLWPVGWLAWTPGTGGTRAILVFYALTNIVGAFFVASRAARVAVFLGLLEYVALNNSFGKIGHSLHLLVIVSGVFILLPAGWTRPAPLAPRSLRQRTLLAFWTAQAAILLTYTMSGLGKVGGAVYQAAVGQPNAFAPGAFGAHVAQRLVQTGSQSALGGWIIHHPYLTWPLMPAAIGFETFALLAAFRPALGLPVAALLILFHVGTYFTMTITFPQSCLLLALFFSVSPFEPTNLSWQKVIFALPWTRKVWTLWPSNRRRPVE